MMAKTKTAVIGIGNMGSAHAECILSKEIDGMELTGVCDIDCNKLGNFHKSDSSVQKYTDYEKLLDCCDADSVIIAVPHRLHSEIAEAALKRGRNVLVEKPIDISVSKAARLNSTAQKSGRVFGIMFNQRTNPMFAKAREIVKSGKLGALQSTVWIVTNWYRTQSYYNSGGWRATWAGEGGGVLLNQAPHNLDIWQWICGMPVSVTAYCDIGKYHNIEVEDNACLFTMFENGARGIFMTSTGEYPGTNRLEISGDLGNIVLENGFLKWWRLKSSAHDVSRFSSDAFAKIDSEYTEYKQENKLEAHKIILQNFANAVLHGERLIAPGTDGIYELTLSNAAYLSAWKGNSEIRLPFDCGEFDSLLREKTVKSKYVPEKSCAVGAGIYMDRWKVNW